MLQFDFLPRRRLKGLRPALALLTLAVVGGFGMLLTRQHAELQRLQEALLTAEQSVSRKAAPAARGASAPWEVNAVRDGELLQLPVEARLLELERCVVNGMSLASFRFDAASNSASAEVVAIHQSQATQLTQCLNQGDGASWVLDSVESRTIGDSGYVLHLRWNAFDGRGR
ncbi:hypothetical protein LRH25_32485 [Ideonella azotifigens]|uniref:hypothetical protein n=1 Tax=Ideonella azotifigens TaxID=513160 RepID=UPI001142C736|nr:hypothetical protein [Ideonella azotifigens]MCD2345034.1 hypothetical protein [Ideonella azotifigens]